MRDSGGGRFSRNRPPRLLIGALLAVLVLPLISAELNLAKAETPGSDVPSVAPGYNALPLSFEPHPGPSAVRFSTRSPGASVYFTPNEVVMALVRPAPAATKAGELPTDARAATAVLRSAFVGANPSPDVAGGAPLPGKVNYLLGNNPAKWRTNLPTFAGISYAELYPGIDLAYDGPQGELKSTYTVAPGADPNAIRWRYEGAEAVHTDSSGNLRIKLAANPAEDVDTDTELVVTEKAPVVWQVIGGSRQPVAASYAVGPDNTVGFTVADYDTQRELVIDPTLEFSTYLGGSGDDQAKAIAVDASGSAYVGGKTLSTDFPVTDGAAQTEASLQMNDYDAFITKLNPEGSARLYSTYLGGGDPPGGGDAEEALGISVDAAGSAYVTGSTNSPDFPVTVGAFRPTYSGRGDAFVTKLNPDGSALVYSTYLGGLGRDVGSSVAVGSDGSAHVTGPGETGIGSAPLSTAQGNFVAKLDPTGSALRYTRPIGADGPTSIAVDGESSVYVAGRTNIASGFATPGSAQEGYSGSDSSGGDAFVMKVNREGSAIIYSTYVGGSLDDHASGVAVDAGGNAYVTGYTNSTGFPTANAYQAVSGGGRDAFVTKLNPAGSAFLYSTYLGGDNADEAKAIVVDGASRAYITGYTQSTNFPMVSALSARPGGVDAFVATIAASGSALFSTYLGGAGADRAFGIAGDGAENVYITGNTASTDFPASSGSAPIAGNAFIAKIADASPAPTTPTTPSSCTDTSAPVVGVLAPAAGPSHGGTEVVITGTGLCGATGVSFGDVEAVSYRVDSPTRLTAVSPPQPAGRVVVVKVAKALLESQASQVSQFRYVEEDWAATGSMPEPLWRHTATLIEGPACAPNCGKVLVAGGTTELPTEGGLPQTGGTAAAALYDPAQGTWERTAAPMQQDRTHHTATLLPSGDVLMVGGASKRLHSQVGRAERYDASSGTWAPVSPPAIQRYRHTATLLRNGQVLVVGGNTATGVQQPSTEESAELYNPDTGEWRPAASLGTPRADHTATLLKDGRVLVTGGRSGPFAPLNSAQIYTPGTGGGTWTTGTAGSMQIPRYEHSATLLNDGRVLVAGGGNATDSQSATTELFDPGAGTGAGAWSVTGSMRTGRRSHVAAAMASGLVLVAGGGTHDNEFVANQGSNGETELYDPLAERWFAGEPMTTARGAATATLLSEGAVLVAGGHRSGRPLASAELFADVGDRLPAIAGIDPPVGSTVGPTEVTISGTGLFPAVSVSFGGVAAKVKWASDKEMAVVAPARPQGSVEVTVTTPVGPSAPSLGSRFAYASDGWRAIEPLTSGPRYLHTTTLLDPPSCHEPVPPPGYPCGKVLVVGGTNDYFDTPPRPGAFLSSAEVYDPVGGVWQATTSLPDGPRFDYTATLLNDGRVLVAGGRSGDPDAPGLATALLYNPVNRTWTRTANDLSERRISHTATKLVDGKVLVAGGAPTELDRDPVASAELFDPANDSWTPTNEPMGEARQLHSATLLPDGGVLVAGGLGLGLVPSTVVDRASVTPTGHYPLASAEVYNPTDRTWSSTAPLAVPRFSQTASLLSQTPCGKSCGMVLVAGGWQSDGSQPISSAELFDPSTRAWHPVATMRTARGGHSATVLTNGTVLVAGSGFPYPLGPAGEASAERFDPQSGRWEPAPKMRTARGLHGAVRLDGPRCRTANAPAYCQDVLVVGGATTGPFGEAPPALAAGELYSPAPTVTSVLPGTGPSLGATEVVVTGTNFEPTSTVTFDGLPATGVRVESPSRLVAVSPRHAPGPVEVGIVNALGSSAHVPPLLDQPFTFAVSAVPAQVKGLAATAVSDSMVILSFKAPSSDSNFPGAGPPAQSYVVKQSATAFTDDASFAAARSVCERGVCELTPTEVGTVLTVEVKDLEPRTVYHYAVAAANDYGQGPASLPASTTTFGDAGVGAVCSAANAVSGQVAYRSGYSLVGLPPGTIVGAQSPLYGWVDQGAGGVYSTQASSQAVTAGRGYWAWFACPSVVNLAAGEESAIMALGAYHASMVGNPSARSPAQVIGHDFAARWDPSLNAGAGGYQVSAYREAQTLGVGEGLWAFNYQRGEIRIEATP